MKRFIILFLSVTSMLMAMAEDKMVFVVGDNVATPITVSVGGHSYTVYSSMTVSQVNGSIRAIDANGNKLKYEFHHSSSSRSGTVDTYTFKNTYNYGSGNSSSSGSSSNDGYYNSSSAEQLGRNIGSALGGLMFGTGGGGQGQAYPGMHVAAGLSKSYGEFVRLRFALRGFNLYGGIGKDWLFDGVNKNKFLWHAGIGGYFAFGGDDPSMDTTFGLTVAENAAWENLSLLFDIDYTYWIGRWRRVGVFAGAGLGFADIKDLGKEGHHSKFGWNLELGLTLRIAHFWM